MGEFLPLQRTDGFLPLSEYGLIGDGATAALIGRDGSVGWLCAPRFDSAPLICPLLDDQRGGHFTVAPVDCYEARHHYLDHTGVLVTELRGRGGAIRITDAMLLQEGSDLLPGARAGAGGLLRKIEPLEGAARVEVQLQLRAAPDVLAGRWCRDGQTFTFDADIPLPTPGTPFTVTPDRPVHLVLGWSGASMSLHQADALLGQTVRAWARWERRFHYDGPQQSLVRRSALTLKLLDYVENGALVAAPTSSLPESIGGERNWDYRYAWVRDVAFYVGALRRIGMAAEADAFLSWLLNDIEASPRPEVLYDLDGRAPPTERTDPELRGYRGSGPVRWGNAAAEQQQHDVFGEVLDLAYQRVAGGRPLATHLWSRLHSLVECARVQWRKPDHGIWEVRSPGRPFTYSMALCAVALERGARLVHEQHLPGDATAWQREATIIRDTIVHSAWSPARHALCATVGGDTLDASVLALPLRRVLPARHPRMRATVDAIAKDLSAGNGLLYRYHPEQAPDGLPGTEGAFLLCSFWWVDNLALQGRYDEAHALFDSLCARASPLGLLPEQIDPRSGAFLGNFPQALSHVGVITSAVGLARHPRGQDGVVPRRH